MEQERFDHLAKSVARGTTRRALLAALSGALVGLGLLPEAAAARKGRGKRRHRHQHSQRKRRAKHKSQAKAAACPLCKRPNARGKCVADPSVNFQCCPAGHRPGFCLFGTCFAGHCTGPICNDQTCADGCCDDAAQCTPRHEMLDTCVHSPLAA